MFGITSKGFLQEKENVTKKHNEALIELRAAQKKEIDDLMQDNDRRGNILQFTWLEMIQVILYLCA